MTEPAVPRIRFGWRAVVTLALTLLIVALLGSRSPS
jgi:hypothetical protein